MCGRKDLVDRGACGCGREESHDLAIAAAGEVKCALHREVCEKLSSKCYKLSMMSDCVLLRQS